MKNQEKLTRLIADCSYKRGDFKLSSGQTSHFYLDAKQVTYHPEGARLVGEAILEVVKRHGAAAVGGLTMGADPIVASTIVTSHVLGSPIKGFVVRKEAKEHGLRKWIEGLDPRGLRVIIVDDVVTSGRSVLMAVKRAREAGAHVAAVACLVDREEGGANRIRKHGVAFEAICSITQIETYIQEIQEKLEVSHQELI